MAVQAGDDDDSDDGLDGDEHEVAATAPAPPVPTGRGRVVPPAAQAGQPQQRRGTSPADSSAAVEAGQEVTVRDTLARLVIDVPDYPQPGVVFKDITPVLADHAAFTEVVEALAAPGRDAFGATVVDYVVGMEARGFILAAPVAPRPGARASCRCARPGKLPRETYAESYALEYGEATLRCTATHWSRAPGCCSWTTSWPRGGTVARRPAGREGGGRRVGASVLMDLSFLPGRDAIGALPLTSLLGRQATPSRP